MNDQLPDGEQWKRPPQPNVNERLRPWRRMHIPIQSQKKKSWMWVGIILSVSIITASVILIPAISSAWASAHIVKPKPAYATSAVTTSNTAYPDLLPGFAKKQLAGGLNHPIVFAFAPNGDIYIGEQAGTILIYRNGAVLPTPLGTISTDGTNEKGLLGLALDPNFATNGYMYVSYTTLDEHAQLSRFTVQNDTLNLASEVVYLKGNQLQNPHHSGNDLHVGPDGKLWWAVGDNVPSISNAQTLTNIYGKILRFRLDGSIPSDNPFLHVPGAVPAIYAYGLRNPWRFTFLPNGKAMTEDTGSSYWEELNTIQPGGNYGWDFYEGNCGSCGYINPAYAYGHLPIDGAASALSAYTGSVFPKQYDNVVFYGDYNRQDIEAVTFDPTFNTQISDTVFDNAAGTIADLQEGPDGNLYFVSIFNNTFSEIYTTGPFTPTASISSSPNAGLAPLSVQFSSAGSSDPYGLPLTYSWDFGDGSPLSAAANPSHIYSTDGTYTATLTVSNGSQTASASIQVVVGHTPPTASITSPAVNATYNGGNTISFSGTATDAADGTLPASAYTWQADFYSNGVAQPFYSSEVPNPFYGPVSGVTSGTFQIPQDLSNNASTFYRITMTVVDSLGLQTVVTRDIHPNTSTWSVNTNVPGAAYVVDGTWHTTSPYSTTDGVGIQHVLTGAPLQTINGVRYRFNGWADGSALTDSFTNGATNATYTANYDQVTNAVPSPWQSVDVGNPLMAGTADYSASDQTFYVDGAGADISGSNDQFHYVYQTLNGDGTIIARVRYQTNSSPWTKAGVMIKQSTTAGSSYVDALVTPDVSPSTPNINGVGCTPDGCLSPLPPITPAVGNGVRMQYNFTGSKTATNLPGYNSPNKWLKLQRTGNTFTTWESTNGNTWTQIGSTSVTMTGPATIGLFVTSHNIGQYSSVAFDNVQVTTQTPPPPPGPLPSPWVDTDVGSPAIAGSASYANGVFTVNGSGTDIYGTYDQFNYVNQPVTGDGNGTLIARVTSQTNTSSNAKAGIMFKQSTTAGSPYILITITPGTSSFKIQYNFNGSIGGGTYTFPNAWMKLTRVGSIFTAYVSADGVTWTQVVSKTLTMNTNITAGLFECSHNASALGTATFDNVSFTSGP
jgi:glucose/arabinose dehydrogenase/regulation of enolase protein 1 (concanavalin A-like superfamily)